MNTEPDASSPQQVRRIGILPGDLDKFNENKTALQFLILQMNKLQKTIE
ncbi:MAG TPA: hypothetical protein VFV38_08010 [Ktedonobacteraceae bacterium]|nr:hypothetical protein [Ktedonobacteraceae bacterium]